MNIRQGIGWSLLVAAGICICVTSAIGVVWLFIGVR